MRRAKLVLLAFFFAPLLAAPRAWSAADAPSAPELQQRARARFGVLPAEAKSAANPITKEKVELGRALYFDKRLSSDGKVSCNSCHVLSSYGVDHEPASLGHAGPGVARNVPTVYNAALAMQFWDGRAASVEEVAAGSAVNPIAPGMFDPNQMVKVLRSIPGYAPLFAAAFRGEAQPVTAQNVGKAIGAFERRLMTPSRFDKFLEGETNALSPAEQAGLATFIDTGCPKCHTGATVGGKMLYKLGVVHPYPTNDTGRALVTGNAADRYFFKVSSLRNVKETAPYFHDGKVKTLEEAVRLMAHDQLGKELSDAEVAAIIAFLESLTAPLPTGFIQEPSLPPSPAPAPKRYACSARGNAAERRTQNRDGHPLRNLPGGSRPFLGPHPV
ncbi:MAG TPA: cytochrome c peroxidase [Myxococcota bacterium]|nr:cytochrome c peroxidase [Myxococcota bacterium]